MTIALLCLSVLAQAELTKDFFSNLATGKVDDFVRILGKRFEPKDTRRSKIFLNLGLVT